MRHHFSTNIRSKEADISPACGKVLSTFLLPLILAGSLDLIAVSTVVGQSISNEIPSEGRIMRVFSNPNGRITTPISFFLSPEQAKEMQISQVTYSPVQSMEREKASRLGLAASALPVEKSVSFLSRGRWLQEIRIHTLLESDQVVTGLVVEYPVESGALTPDAQLDRAGKSQQIVNSPFSNGNWYKIKVQETGIYELTGASLAAAGVSITGSATNQIQIWGRP